MPGTPFAPAAVVQRSRATLLLIILTLAVCAGCTTDRTRRGYLRASASQFTSPPERPVIIVPGFGVSRLFDPVTGRYAWGTAHAMMQRRYPDDLDLPAGARDRLIPQGFAGSRGPINIAWQLTYALEQYGGYKRDRNLYTFAYDWRLAARDNAERLAAFVDEVRRAHGNRSVDVVTHSAGAMVGLAYVKLLPDRSGGAVEHLVLMAPVQRGVPDAFRLLARGERVIRRSFAPAMAITWPSVPELLPEEGRFLVDDAGRAIDFDAWDAASWPRIGLAIDPQLLSRARTFRDELRDRPFPADVRMTVIAGDCVATTSKVLMRGDRTFAFYRSELRDEEQRLAQLLFEPGDGTVPVSSATAGGQAMLFCDGHQGIASDPNVHRALIRLFRR